MCTSVFVCLFKGFPGQHSLWIKGGGETSSNLLPVSAVSNLASSNGQLANGRAIPKGQHPLE